MHLTFGTDRAVVKEDFHVAPSPGSHDPIIPDFKSDAAAVAAYADARARFERRIASDAEERTRAAYVKKRAIIRAEIGAAASFVDDCKENAEKALRNYGGRFERRVVGNKPVKPSFWEVLLSLGWAQRMFKHALVTADEVVQAQSRRRRWQRDEDDLEAQFHRTLYLEDDARKKFFEGPDSTAAFHAEPGVSGLSKRVAEIKAERLRYATRLGNGEVLPTEQRDRAFAEQQISPLGLPFSAMTIVRITRYGDLTYFILRDLEGKLCNLGYDVRLEPLIDCVMDAYRVVDSYEVRLSPSRAGTPMTVADHYAANFKDEELGRSEYRKARVALRTPRSVIPPMIFHMTLKAETNERDIVDLLASFAQALKAQREKPRAASAIRITEPSGSQ